MNELKLRRKGVTRRWRRYSAKEIKNHLQDWTQSGLTLRDYAARQGLSYWTMQGWRRRKPPQPGRAAQAKFASVPLSAMLGPGWGAEVNLPSGETVRLSAQVPAAWAAELMAALRPPC